MKEKDAHFNSPNRIVLFVEKEDGSYGPMVTGSYMVEQHIDDFMQKRATLQRKASERLLKNEISPVEYYRILLELSSTELAGRVSVGRRACRRHADPRFFPSVRIGVLQRYAGAFGIPVANLFQILVPDSEKTGQSRTANPYVTITYVSPEE
jgi:hypothetical protein